MNTNKFSSPEFLDCVAKYFHGIFLTTMIEDLKSRNALAKYISTNNDLFQIVGGKDTSTKIYILSNAGIKKFGKFSAARPKNIISIIDYALINSAMYELGELKFYSMESSFQITLNGKIYTIDSAKSGLPKMGDSYDFIISTPKRKIILNGSDLINSVFIPRSFIYSQF